MVFQDYSSIYFLSEYLEGTSLDSLLKKTFKEDETSSKKKKNCSFTKFSSFYIMQSLNGTPTHAY